MANHASLIRLENNDKPIKRRGRRFIEFDMGGGVTRHVATIEPLHKRNSETEIDATWYPDTGAWQWKIGENDWQAHARDVFNAGNLIEWRHESGEWVIIDPQSINWINQDNSRQQIAIKQAVTGIANDATLTFPEAYGTGKHFSYTAHPRKLIKHFTIDNFSDLPAPEPWLTGTLNLEVEWTITNSTGVELWLDGVKWARTNGVRVTTANQIEFRSETTGEVLWWADAPTATDASGETSVAEYEVERQSGTYFIRVRLPREWMVSAAYPVQVDPTFTDGYGGDVTSAYDAWLWSLNPDSNYGSEITLFNDGPNMQCGIIEFDLSSISSDATCNSATLYVYRYLSAGGGSGSLLFYSLMSANGGWTEAGVTWNTVDGVNNWAGSAGCNTSGTDYEASALGSIPKSSTDPQGTEYDISLTASRVEDWFGASNTNYGLKGTTDTYTCSIASSDHSTAEYRPKLVVEYTEGGTPQYARPNADISLGGWTDQVDQIVDIYQSINEAIPNDLDYIKSSVNPTSDAVIIGLESKPAPIVDTGHVLRYRYKKEGSGTVNINVALMEGTSVIASWQHDDIGVITTAEQTLTELQAGSITDYSNLRFRVIASEP